MNNERARRGNRQRGVALLLTLVLIVAMLGMGFLAVYLSSSGVGLSSNLGARQAAMNAAQAGIQHARTVLASVGTSGTYGGCSNANGWNCILAGRGVSQNGVASGRTYADQLPSSGNPSAIGAILYDATAPLVEYPNPPANVQAKVLGRYTVFLRNDAADITNGNFATDTNTTVIIRSIGTDPSGTAQVVVEASVLQTSTAGGASNANTVFGKNIDPYGSNAITGSFHF